MDLVLRTVNCALFAESFQLVVALGVGISLFQFLLIASNSKSAQWFSQLTVCHDDQIRLDCICSPDELVESQLCCIPWVMAVFHSIYQTILLGVWLWQMTLLLGGIHLWLVIGSVEPIGRPAEWRSLIHGKMLLVTVSMLLLDSVLSVGY